MAVIPFQLIEGLETLKYLEEIFLGKNKISKLCGFESLRNLRLLSIQVRLF